MFNKWSKEIGFSHPKTISKIMLRKKLGYYIPKISYSERLKLLSKFKINSAQVPKRSNGIDYL